jgi:putative transposase
MLLFGLTRWVRGCKVPQVRALGLGGNLGSQSFWQKRYYDRNVRDAREFSIKLRYLHRNSVTRGLVSEPAEWKWSSFRHYALREVGVVEVESEWTARDRETQTKGGPLRVFLSPPG